MAKELESLCACLALDIEFGLDRTGKLYLFQVRRMARARHWHPVTERRVARQLEFVERFVQECSLPREGVVGERTILAIMPDWNPAELIGTTPQPLSSLYRTLITRSTWREARAEMGYQELGDGELMYLINSHPYIDVRMSFNSFLPEGLDRDTGGKLVSAWMNRLSLARNYTTRLNLTSFRHAWISASNMISRSAIQTFSRPQNVNSTRRRCAS